ncbi:serine/threonine protein phosphatase 2A 57 kDa regulatory subunit B' alpha isoform-like [Phragmites australis]|uniref:serine/threonine protein phosphatase 2A 57 kDa regulatory subunit B' alpha isoform-like n=1 Tax=Phragmites australis TaxID=29695 RepID=UPI002D769668|nr:serine/threonine protein phosphatase 2A 57 kDa regulatory subunit B' alpha isoform-like [Phragmites australis]
MGAAAAEVAPRAPSAKRRSTTLRFLFELEKPDGLLPGTAKLPPPSLEPEADSLIDKIASCNRLFTFVDVGECEEERDAKQERLGEVLAAVRSSGKQQLDHRVLVALVKMVSANLFRTMPPSAYPPLPPDGVDEEPPVMLLAPSWPHLHVVYDILLAVVTGADARTLRNHVDRAFLSRLLALFGSEDPRERDRLKTVYHQLYSKLTCERAFMRRSMSAAFLRFVYETSPAERHCGVGELLEICGSIINGLAVPLKEEHRGFLVRVLLPLHRTRWAHTYHRQLAYCVLQFVQKEPELANAVVTGILRHWPVTNCQKEVLLIEELEEILEVLEPKQLEKLVVPICSRIARCVSSCSSQVAERALYVWYNERFLELASGSPGMMEKILPAFVASVEGNLELHWSKCVQQVTASVKALLEQVAPDLYGRCVDDLTARRSEAEAAASVRDARWQKLETAIATK